MILITDILKEINEDLTAGEKYKNTSYGVMLKIVLENAFDPEKKWILPEGDIPYKKPKGIYRAGETEGHMYSYIKQFYIFYKEGLPDEVRQKKYISMLETLSIEEDEFLEAIKDQSLLVIYPNLNIAKLSAYGFIDQETVLRFLERVESEKDENELDLESPETSDKPESEGTEENSDPEQDIDNEVENELSFEEGEEQKAEEKVEEKSEPKQKPAPKRKRGRPKKA